MTPRRLKAIKRYPAFADIRPLIAEVERLQQEDGITLDEQNQVRNFVIKRTDCPPAFIDGSGCESGEALEVTLAEIGQGFSVYEDEIERLRGLVKSAYIEAYQNDWCWANSESRKALEGK